MHRVSKKLSSINPLSRSIVQFWFDKLSADIDTRLKIWRASEELANVLVITLDKTGGCGWKKKRLQSLQRYKSLPKEAVYEIINSSMCCFFCRMCSIRLSTISSFLQLSATFVSLLAIHSSYVKFSKQAFSTSMSKIFQFVYFIF